MKQLSYILDNEADVLAFLKARYPMYHLSNVFFRDIQYGIQLFLERKEMSVGYTAAEKISRAFVEQLEKKKILTPIDAQSWVLNYPDFRKPPVKPAAPARPAAKPAATAPAAPRPAGGLPPLKSAPVAAPAVAQPAKSTETGTAQPAEPAPPPAKTEPAPKPAPAPSGGKTVPPLGARPLPPIKSSTPAGSKK